MQREFGSGCRLGALFLICVFVVTGIAVPARGGADDTARPTEFYLVSEVTSDAWPFWYRYILQVKPEGRGSRVRYIRIAPMDSMCARSVTVESATSVLPSASPADLSAGYEVCSVDPGTLDRDLRMRTHTAVIDDAIRFGIVARCGGNDVVLHFPYKEQVELSGSGDKSRELAHWWEFQRVVKERAFGPGPVFDHMSTEKLEEQEEREREAETVVPEVRAGLFDRGLNPRCAPLAPCPMPSLRDELEDYVGPLGFASPVPRLAKHYRFERYVAPKYPPLAMRSHLSGRVVLDLRVDPSTGSVREAKAIEGHFLLREAALTAARQWRFAHENTSGSGSVLATLMFDFGCPQPVGGRAAR